MKMKVIAAIIFTVTIATVSSSAVDKFNNVIGRVKIIETDLHSASVFVTSLDFGDRLYRLAYSTEIIFTRDFISVAFLKFNSNNDLYIFDQIDDHTRNVWMLRNTTISNLFNYSATVDMGAFFDNEDNLLLDTVTGISILPNGGQIVNPIRRLEGYHLISREHSFDADSSAGHIYISVRKDETSKVVGLVQSEKIKPDPRPFFFNLDQFGNVRAQKFYNQNLYLVHDKAIIKLNNINTTVLYEREEAGYGEFYVSKDRIFVKYFENGICNIKEITSTDTLLDIGINIKQSCESIIQTTNFTGAVFFGSSDYGGVVQYVTKDNVVGKVNIRNAHYIYGMDTNEIGNLWILTQNVVLVPFGRTEPEELPGLPYETKPYPMKVQPGSNFVFIGSEDGIYLGIMA